MSQKCLKLPEHKFATLILEKDESPYNINDTIQYKCSDGYKSGGKKNLVFTCKLINNVAVWDFDESACKPVSCGHPGFLENATLHNSVFSFPDYVYFKCNEGYKYVGVISKIDKEPEKVFTTYCSSTGKWIPSIARFKCVPIICPQLQVPLNGSIHYSNATHYNSEASYSCNTGYILKGNKIRTCTNLGNWDGTDPICEKMTCPKPIPSAPENSYDVGHVFTFKCPLTHQIFVTKCKENGQWTIKINCNNDSNNANSNDIMNPNEMINTMNNVILSNTVHPQNNVSLRNNVNPNNNINKNKNVNLNNTASLSNNAISKNNLISSNAILNNSAGNSTNIITSNKSITPINNIVNQSKLYFLKNKLNIILIICLVIVLIVLMRAIVF